MSETVNLFPLFLSLLYFVNKYCSYLYRHILAPLFVFFHKFGAFHVFRGYFRKTIQSWTIINNIQTQSQYFSIGKFIDKIVGHLFGLSGSPPSVDQTYSGTLTFWSGFKSVFLGSFDIKCAEILGGASTIT